MLFLSDYILFLTTNWLEFCKCKSVCLLYSGYTVKVISNCIATDSEENRVYWNLRKVCSEITFHGLHFKRESSYFIVS